MQGQKEKDRRSRRKTKIEEGKKHEYQGKARRISEVSLPSGRVWAICAFLLDKAALAKFLYGGKEEKKKREKKSTLLHHSYSTSCHVHNSEVISDRKHIGVFSQNDKVSAGGVWGLNL